MKQLAFAITAIIGSTGLCLAQAPPQPSLEDLIPAARHRSMGINKLTRKQKERLREHIVALLSATYEKGARDARAGRAGPAPRARVGRAAPRGKVYANVGRGHWVDKNIDSGTFILLEDGSLWQIDPLERLDAMLWLTTSSVTVVESSRGSPGYDYLLINTDDGEKAHAKYMGKR